MKNKEYEEHSSKIPQTQLSNQTRSRIKKDMILFAIMHKTGIRDSFASIIIKSTWFCKELILVQNQNLMIKTHLKMLLMYKTPRLFSNNDRWTRINWNLIKISSKTST